MYRFEPTPPTSGPGGSEPDNPYAQPPQGADRTARSCGQRGRSGPVAAHSQAAPGLPDATPYPTRGSSGGPWGPPGYNHHPQATLAMVLGILGVAGFSLVAPFAWWIAQRGLREAARSPYPVDNRGQLVAGQVLGVIGTIFLALGIVVGFVWMVVVIGLAASG